MKKRILIGMVLAIMLFSSQIWACYYAFESEVESVNAGDSFDVKVNVIYEHRNCVIELEDTQFKFTGLELVKQGEWVQEKRGTYSVVLTMKALEAGDSKLEVIRECSKKGISAGEWKVSVAESNEILSQNTSEDAH